jgi:KRAB domain-containing zinc finger protein
VAIAPIHSNVLLEAAVECYPATNVGTNLKLRQHVCPYCQIDFSSKASMRRHIRTLHRNIKIIFCSYCKKYFKSGEEKEIHRKEHHSVRYPCMVCSKSFSHWYLMHAHLRKKHANEIFECKYISTCASFFKTEEERSMHIIKVHESREDSVRCIYCKKFVRSYYLKDHIRIQHNSVAIKCEYLQKCPTYFLSKKERDEHYLKVHESDTKDRVKCAICCKMVCSSRIYIHMRCYHKLEISLGARAKGVDPQFENCLYCNCVIEKRLMHYHVSYNHKSIAIKCNFRCGKYFQSVEKRQEHILKVHSTRKKVGKKGIEQKCLYCGKIVRYYRHHLNHNHSSIIIRCKYLFCVTYFHTKEEREKHYVSEHSILNQMQPVNCTKCTQKFWSERNLKMHMQKMHYNGNLKCEMCEKTYRSVSSMKSHMITVHLKTRECSVCKIHVVNLHEHALKGNCKL